MLAGAGCLDPLIFNPALVNRLQGGLFPFVPGPDNNLLLVRVVNATDTTLRFLVTVEKSRTLMEGSTTGMVTDAETTELFTVPGAQSNEAGVLFDCFAEDPITRVGLGQNLDRPTTERGLFVGGEGDITQGFGVPPNIGPLSLERGDYMCGDTVIFEAFESAGAPGGFKVRAFVLPYLTQPTSTTRDTFTVAADFLRDRVTE